MTAEQCEYAIKMCKDARPMAEVPSSKVFPYFSKTCPCCFRKAQKAVRSSRLEGQVADNMLTKLSSQFKTLRVSKEES